MKTTVCKFFFLFLLVHCSATAQWTDGRLQVSPDHRGLQWDNGKPFFWLGDTGWLMFNRLTLEEIKSYLDNRAAKGFNVIQAMTLTAHDLHHPNRYGELILKSSDPFIPNEKYFSIVDKTIEMAQQRKLLMALVVCWGDPAFAAWGDTPLHMDTTKAFAFGEWIGARYKNYPNIIWVMGGDRPPKTDTSDFIPMWRALANGIIKSTGHNGLITYHPAGYRTSSEFLHQEPWMDFNMIQSGHSSHDTPNWTFVTKDLALQPTKPVLDAEPCYEDHPVDPWPVWKVENGYFRDYDIRKQSYRSVFSGACGISYGHHAIWQFMSERDEAINFADRGWRNAMDRPGAFQVGYLRKLIESRPMNQRIPDNTILASGQGEKGEYATAFRDVSNSYMMVYLPLGKAITVNTSFMKCKNIRAWWFNPRDSTTHKIGVQVRQSEIEFVPPVGGSGNDWVLVVDDASKNFKAPGL